MKKKKLLVLAGNDVHIKVIEAAKELGVYTIVTDYLPYESSPAKHVADEYWNISTSDYETLVRKCKDERIDGVLNFCIDTVQAAYQQLCEKLDLPCYGNKELIDIFTNKKNFKAFCRKFGVDVIPEYTLQDVESGNAEFPLLIKPSDSRGSRGITICRSIDDLPAAIDFAKSESRDGNVLIERYMIGCQDMSFAYMVIDGQPYLVKIGDRIVGKETDGLQCQQMATVLPSRNVKQFIKNVQPNIEKMIEGTRMKFGVVFLQGFWENGHVYMYDPGLRFPGSEFDIATKKITGFDSMKAFVDFAVTGDFTACYGDPNKAYTYNGKTCLILSISCRPGKISKFTGIDKIEALPNVMSVRQIYKEGETVPSTHDVRQRVAEFVVILDDASQVNDFAEFVYNNVHILDADGIDMIVSKVKY